jgi:8-oxo-dGTP diphosphatase
MTNPSREIVKIGLAVTKDKKLLLVRKRGGTSYILPGGKPECGEDDLQALLREIDEELGCGLDLGSLSYLGSFSDVAADLQNTVVTVRLYSAELTGSPDPRAEIEHIAWLSPVAMETVTLAPSLLNSIVPFLSSSGRL